MEEIDGRQVRVPATFIRVSRRMVLALVVVAALWLLAAVGSGIGRTGAGAVPQPVPRVTVAPAAGQSAR